MADKNTSKHTVRNTAPGPRGLNTVAGYLELAPGQTAKDVELNEAEYESAKGVGYFHFDAVAKREAKADDQAQTGDALPNNPMQLKKIARDEGIDVGGATSGADLQAAILAGRKAKADASGSTGQADQSVGNTDALDAMDDETLRTTVQAIIGKAPPEDADRAALLQLARNA